MGAAAVGGFLDPSAYRGHLAFSGKSGRNPLPQHHRQQRRHHQPNPSPLPSCNLLPQNHHARCDTYNWNAQAKGRDAIRGVAFEQGRPHRVGRYRRYPAQKRDRYPAAPRRGQPAPAGGFSVEHQRQSDERQNRHHTAPDQKRHGVEAGVLGQ